MHSSKGTLVGRKIAYSGAQSLGALSDGAINEVAAGASDGYHKRTTNLEPVAIICGNIPENSSNECAIRLLFGTFGQIRRVILRRKSSPSTSWCLITYRSSTSVKAALATPVVVKDADGNDVQLTVELPEIEKKLMDRAASMDTAGSSQRSLDLQIPSPSDGRGQEESMLTTASEPSASPSTLTDGSPTPAKVRRKRRTLSMPGRRHSVVELEIRKSLYSTAETSESSSALAADQSRGRRLWQNVRKAKFRNKLAVAALFVQNDDQNEKAAKRAIKDMLHDVRLQEISITTTLKGFAQLYNGEMRGLDYRFKTEASLFRKVMSRLDKALAEAAVSKTPPPSPDDILKSVLDVLRYTVVFKTKSYTFAVREMIHALKEHGYRQHRVKNFWGPGDGYQGINSVFVSPAGQAFELQFHTPESLSMKEEECHSSYAKFRTASDSRKMMQYWEEMVSLWDMVPVPEGVLEIPEVVQQKLEFDLTRLSERERAAIQHRKSLEQVCRYPVLELHHRAVKAEAEIGALMVYLMHKHGPGESCEQKEKRSAVRAQLSMLRQLVDGFIVAGDNENDSDDGQDDYDTANSNDDDGNYDVSGAKECSVDKNNSRARTRSRAATMSDQSFGKVSVGVKLASQQRMASVDIKEIPAADKAKSNDRSPSVDITALPDEPTVRDRLRSLEHEFPPLKYKIVCNNEHLYTTIVQGFLRDIASDSDYDIYAVNNWWDDLEKFGAVNARFLAIRHGLRFEVTFHTEESWDASTEHSEYMRRKFDTVIKTDVLFTDKPQLVDQVKSQMRREEMWRERWARISVPDRALTIGTLRYAHIPAPEASELTREAQLAVGNSHAAVNRFQKSVNKVRHGLRLSNTKHADSDGSSSHHAHSSSTLAHSSDSQATGTESAGSVGSVWAEIVGAFFDERQDIAEMFDKFKATYIGKRGADQTSRQPLASRFAALEQQMKRIEEHLAAEQPGGLAATSTTPGAVSSINTVVTSNPPSILSSKRVDAHDGSMRGREGRSLSFVPMIATSTSCEPIRPACQRQKTQDDWNAEESPPKHGNAAASVVESVHGGVSASSSSSSSSSSLSPPSAFSSCGTPVRVGRASSASMVAMLKSPAIARPGESEGEREGTSREIHNKPLPELLDKLLRNQEAICRLAKGT